MSPLGAQLAIIADLTPNSQLAPARRSALIIYRLPQHLQPAVDQRAAALFLLALPRSAANSFVAFWGFEFKDAAEGAARGSRKCYSVPYVDIL